MDGISEMAEAPDQPLRVTLLVNWGIGLSILETLHKLESAVICRVITQCVVSAPDPWANIVFKRAEELGYPTLKFSELSDDALIMSLENDKSDLLLVHAYPKRLSSRVYQFPRLGALNVHPSLLPKHPGRDPSRSVLASGETETGLTVHVIDDGFDTGPILHQIRISVEQTDCRISLIEKMKLEVPALIEQTVKNVQNDTKPIAQSDYEINGNYQSTDKRGFMLAEA